MAYISCRMHSQGKVSKAAASVQPFLAGTGPFAKTKKVTSYKDFKEKAVAMVRCGFSQACHHLNIARSVYLPKRDRTQTLPQVQVLQHAKETNSKLLHWHQTNFNGALISKPICPPPEKYREVDTTLQH